MRRALAVILGAVLLVVVGAMFGPRAAHAIVATLVQVVNTSANPVPVVNPPSVLVANGNVTLATGVSSESGPFDVSNYASIRFYGDPSAATQARVSFDLLSVDSTTANLFVLAQLSGISNAGEPVFVTGAYPTPGR